MQLYRDRFCTILGQFIWLQNSPLFPVTDELAEDCTGRINKTVASVLEGKNTRGIVFYCAMLEMYEEMPIFIPVDIMEEAVELVARKVLGSSSPRGTDP